MTHGLRPFFRSLAVRWAALLLAASAAFGSSRDFGTFLFSVPALGVLLLLALAFTVPGLVHDDERGPALLALALIGLAPLAFRSSYGLDQELSFLLWAPSHRQELALAARRDGVVGLWDSWGIAGLDQDSYLVVDTQDRLRDPQRAEAWRREARQKCEFGETRRVWPRFYLVTTDTECFFDHVPRQL